MGKKEYSISDAARDVAKNMLPGQKLLGYMICNRMREALYRNGYHGHPMETTLMARFREVEKLYNIDSIQGISEYTKRVEVSQDLPPIEGPYIQNDESRSAASGFQNGGIIADPPGVILT